MADGDTMDRTRRGLMGPEAREGRDRVARRHEAEVDEVPVGGGHGSRERVGPAADRAAPSAATDQDGRSIGALIKELSSESSRLIREEVQLVKAEMREKVTVYERNIAKMVIGGVLLLGALVVLLVAVNRGLTALLELFMAVEVAIWLAPLILSGVFALIGWSMVKAGQRAIKDEGITPTRTVDTIREETNWAKREAREVRNG